ncbi:MAG: hypothetical protein ACYC8V_16235, partial [Caulobacteraceae bacterium]
MWWVVVVEVLEAVEDGVEGLDVGGQLVDAVELFRSFYTDRGSHYFLTPKAGGKVGRNQPTQVGRALAQLGIEHIAAYSPEARGRSERMFRTL